jgi:hypothetical protein
LLANEKNRLRWVVLGPSQDGAFIDLLENHSKNSLKEDLSNITTFNPPLFSLVNTFKYKIAVPWVRSGRIGIILADPESNSDPYPFQSKVNLNFTFSIKFQNTGFVPNIENFDISKTPTRKIKQRKLALL